MEKDSYHNCRFGTINGILQDRGSRAPQVAATLVWNSQQDRSSASPPAEWRAQQKPRPAIPAPSTVLLFWRLEALTASIRYFQGNLEQVVGCLRRCGVGRVLVFRLWESDRQPRKIVPGFWGAGCGVKCGCFGGPLKKLP